MTVQLNWPPEVVDRLTEEARLTGLSLDAYVLQVVSLRQSSNDAVDEPERRRQRQEAADSIRELRKGNILGPDITVRTLIEEGRRF